MPELLITYAFVVVSGADVVSTIETGPQVEAKDEKASLTTKKYGAIHLDSTMISMQHGAYRCASKEQEQVSTNIGFLVAHITGQLSCILSKHRSHFLLRL